VTRSEGWVPATEPRGDRWTSSVQHGLVTRGQ
jgi:hypothetical protein